MKYIASQYSVTEEMIMQRTGFIVLRPDGRRLLILDTAQAAHSIADELNELLILPFDHDCYIYEEFPILTVCNKCGIKKENVCFLDKYIGYRCFDCEMPF